VPSAVLIGAIGRALTTDRAAREDRANLAELRRRYDSLTPREQEVMGLVVSGRLNKQSAAELDISEKTIKVHRARVMEKMNVEALAQLVLMAERLGITPGIETLGPDADRYLDQAPFRRASAHAC
jgi:FixJ family two-component response regulator